MCHPRRFSVLEVANMFSSCAIRRIDCLSTIMQLYMCCMQMTDENFRSCDSHFLMKPSQVLNNESSVSFSSTVLRTDFKLCADRVFVIIPSPVLHVLSLVLVANARWLSIDSGGARPYDEASRVFTTARAACMSKMTYRAASCM